ncbi:uncharacterized protein LOC113204296 isoform X3 [Frankliniella occidentalis]|uniref:Uncharacterized protein LOC113204296 isoform X3 n=1 Tax=Frankliniella occidentalis TaxID=133901 RepID=A0A6J1S3I5_FRAOC|nr:uncharacterized protein LOC113204296 isoform X3 [Frankliniella occidentalis]
MADTSQAEQPPQTNGFADDGLDEEDREKIRPADIDADVREMERRKRVEMIMNSRLFREELERIFDTQMKEGGAGPGGLLQQLSDMMGHGGPKGNNMFRSSSCVIPINDIRGLESMGYSKGEKVLRCKLAAVYRLMDLYGWTQGIHNHITARLNQDEEHFLVNPWGMLYHEITASSLAKVDMQGNIVEKGTTNYGVNKDSFQLHSAIHAARPDIKCIIHIHVNSVLAVSSLKCGLLPLCQESCVVGEVSSHQYQGGLFEPEERDKISRNLGPNNKVMFLTNHGAMCCGETVEEAFFNVYNTVQACESQIKLMPMGVENLVLLTDETRKRVYDAARRPPDGFALDKSDKEKDKEVTSPTIAAKGKRWGVGCTEFEALMRMLDNAGFRTGYIYRHPLIKGDPPRPRNDVEVPPAVSSLGYLLEEEEMYRQGGWKKWMEGRKTHDRTRWLNSPNVYQKVEILETGTPDPKKITKWVDSNADEWVADGSPTHSSTPVKIDTLQFVPKNTNTKEFKRLQQQIKENRRADKITSGPQSHILEGVSWEEAKKLQDANISQTGDQVILVGAASKGIIQRGFQHNAMVYKTPYAKNPFDTVTDDELEEYKKTVTRKVRGDGYDEDQSESEALSSSAAGRPPTGKSPTSPISDDESRDDSDYPDAHVERSKSARFPLKATPDLVIAPGGFARSWSLGRNKRQSRDCSSKKLQHTSDCNRCPLTKSLPAVSRPHFHHAAYLNLPCTQSTKTVSSSSPCSITRFSQVNKPAHQNQAVSDFVSIMTAPKRLSNSGTIHKEMMYDGSDGDDGDSLADVSSLPYSDVGCLDENHNVTIEETCIKSVKVELKSINNMYATLETSFSDVDIKNSEVLPADKDCTDSEESHTPLETCDTTVIVPNLASNGLGVEDPHVEVDIENEKLQLGASYENNISSERSDSSNMSSQNLKEVANPDQHNEPLLFHVDEAGDNPDACSEKLSVHDLNPRSSSHSSNDNAELEDKHDDTILVSCKMSESLEASLSSNENSEVNFQEDEPVCGFPYLESLNAESKTTLCIGENEMVDLYSIVSLNHGDTSISDDGKIVEEVVATRSESIGGLNEWDLHQESETEKTPPDSLYMYDVSRGNLEIEDLLHSSDSEDDASSCEDIPNFHDISRGNFEVAEIICSLSSPRPSSKTLSQTSFSISSDIETQTSEHDYGNENQSIPNGAGEILYDPSETCSDEFFSPLSTFSNVAFTTDSGEEYYSLYPPVSTEHLGPADDDLSTIDGNDIEIDCDPFSRSSSLPNNPTIEERDIPKNDSEGVARNVITAAFDDFCTSGGNTLDEFEDCWPSFVSCDDEIMVSSDVLDKHEINVQSDLDDDERTICVEHSDSTLRSAGKRRLSFSKFSISTPDVDCAGRFQSSPLELGRLFTLKKFKSYSESRLNNCPHYSPK